MKKQLAIRIGALAFLFTVPFCDRLLNAEDPTKHADSILLFNETEMAFIQKYFVPHLSANSEKSLGLAENEFNAMIKWLSGDERHGEKKSTKLIFVHFVSYSIDRSKPDNNIELINLSHPTITSKNISATWTRILNSHSATSIHVYACMHIPKKEPEDAVESISINRKYSYANKSWSMINDGFIKAIP